ncbi:HAD family hydrolase [Lysobacter sp. LF1]|uniref:HAD family hydrolase n=1 Tax=Lysobacter stagni TaxID=3045172 RepID=A0ABT6XDD2_9GAMM|nr:HAD family hydrolase [Lysobacter sp. LF1]MDI9238147.1 HAD family hydrolase [Lysobacter sp. LF1]
MNLALFDFDGTLTNRELYPEFVRFAASPRQRAVGGITLAPLVVGYKLGVVSGNTIRERVTDFAFRGRRQEELEAFGERFAREIIPASLRPHAMERLQWHREQGDTVVVVSGGFDLYLKHWCALHGLALLCSSLEMRDGVATGRYHGAQCVGEEKARRVRAQYDLSDHPVIHAYGDTPEDRELLALAHRRWYRWQEA